MENWGLISYREDALLFNPERHNLRAQKKISIFISHEIAHQWVNKPHISLLKFYRTKYKKFRKKSSVIW
jgi:hypothetical protein